MYVKNLGVIQAIQRILIYSIKMKNLIVTKKIISLLCFAIGCFLIYFYVGYFGVNLPVADDWNNIETFLLWKSYGIDAKSLFALHNEHCIATSRLFSYFILCATQGDFKAIMLFNATLASAFLATVLIIIRKWKLPIIFFILLNFSISLAVSSWCQWQNLLWAFQTPFFMLPSALIWSGILLGRLPNATLAFLVAMLITWVCIFTNGNGLFVGWSLIPIAISRAMFYPVPKRLFLLGLFFLNLLVATAFTAFLIFGIQHNNLGGLRVFLEYPLKVIFVGLCVLGSPIFPLNAFNHENAILGFLGILTILYATAIAIYYFKNIHNIEFSKFGTGVTLATYGVLSVLAVTYSRSNLLLSAPIESRYQSFALLWIIGLILCGSALVMSVKRFQRTVLISITSILFIVFITGNIKSAKTLYIHGCNMKKIHLEQQQTIRDAYDISNREKFEVLAGHYGVERLMCNISKMQLRGILHHEINTSNKPMQERVLNLTPFYSRKALKSGTRYAHSSDMLSFEGWFDPEIPYRWNSGTESVIKFSIDNTVVKSTRLILVCALNGSQKVFIRINGIQVYSNALDGNLQSINIDLPERTLKIGENILKVDVPDARFAGPNDPRILGFAFGSMTLE
jgi:hypothetical protein